MENVSIIACKMKRVDIGNGPVKSVIYYTLTEFLGKTEEIQLEK